jgi:hypothetical protein
MGLLDRVTIKKDGLPAYLNDEKVRQRHGGHGYDKLLAMYENKATKAAIMREFKAKSQNTVTAWITWIEEHKDA